MVDNEDLAFGFITYDEWNPISNKTEEVRLKTYRCLCGDLPEIQWYGGGGCDIECTVCGLSVGHHPSPRDGVAKWNRCLSPYYAVIGCGADDVYDDGCD